MKFFLPEIYTIQNNITIIEWNRIRIYICPEVIVIKYGSNGEKIFRRWFR